MIHTKPFKNVCAFLAFLQAPHIEGDHFYGFHFDGGDGGTTLQFYGVAFPTATGPVGLHSPCSALYRCGLSLRLSF